MRLMRHALLPWVVAPAMTAAAGDPATSPATRPKATRPALPPADRLDLYLLMGQSNMIGRDTRMAPSDRRTDPHILAMDKEGRWQLAADPLPHEGMSNGVGLGMSFARHMRKLTPDRSIGLIPTAVGGSPLSQWVKGGELYEKAVRRAREAKKAGRLAGVLWHQGETDTGDKELAATYQRRLTGMIADLRRDLGEPDLPVVVGALGAFLDEGKWPFVPQVNQALADLLQRVPRTAFVGSEGLTDLGDRVHFDARSARELGRRYAQSMAKLRQDRSVRRPP